MFKKVFLVAVVFFFSFASIEALLPPLFESIAEIKSILDDKRLHEMLESGEIIIEIKKIEEGYSIKTNHQIVNVKIAFKPIARPGPAQYEFEFKKAKPIEDSSP